MRGLEKGESMMSQAVESESFRPRRSCLYMPASNTRALEKARSIAADTIIIDLEDAVAPEEKISARAAAAQMVSQKPYGHREVVVRVNAPDTPWGTDDISAIVAAKPDAILFPKITDPEGIVIASKAMDQGRASPDMALWVMIETSAAILNMADIGAAAKGTRLSTFVMGTNDLAKEFRARLKPGRAAFHSALQLSLVAARANDLTAIDGVFNDISDEAGLAAECRQGREFGFDGKTLIHPAQIGICNEIFAPSREEVSEARGIVEGFANPDNSGKGVIKVNGKMTELLHLVDAKRTLAIADAIAAIEN